MNTNRLLLHTLAAALAGQIILIAQDPPPAPPPPPPPADLDAPVEAAPRAVQHVEQQLRSVGEQVRTQIAQANRAVALAHASQARQLAQANRAMQLVQAAVERNVRVGEPPEPPEPPEAPEAPEDVLSQNIEHSIQLWDGENGAAFGLGGGFGGVGGGFGAGGSFGGASEPLIVPEGEPKPEALAEAREDLSILSRILRKAAGRTDGQPEAMGIMLSSLPGLRQPQAMYLGGYGALFLLNVQFPLAPAEEVEKQPAEKSANTAWEEARRELYGPKRPSDPFVITKTGPQHRVAYNADRVAGLKRELIEVLKHASNLRHVSDGEQVVVTVTSTAGAGAGARNVMRIEKEKIERRYGSRSTGSSQPLVVEVHEERRGGPGTTLVLRVKKADADAYAAGKLEHEEFAKRVRVTTY